MCLFIIDVNVIKDIVSEYMLSLNKFVFYYVFMKWNKILDSMIEEE